MNLELVAQAISKPFEISELKVRFVQRQLRLLLNHRLNAFLGLFSKTFEFGQIARHSAVRLHVSVFVLEVLLEPLCVLVLEP